MHASVWETVADALFWLQLCLVFSGFILMAYLALKVFPGSSKAKDAERDRLPHQEESRRMKSSDERSERDDTRLMVAGNYRLESFPPQRAGRLIEFSSKISKVR